MSENPKKEPMFLIKEPAPFWLAVSFISAYVLRSVLPIDIAMPISKFLMLTPIGAEGTLQTISGIVGHAWAHMGWDHVLLNSFIGFAFGVMTLRGMRQKNPFEPYRKRNMRFLCVFLLGVIGSAALTLLWWWMRGAINVAAIGASGGVFTLLAIGAYAWGGWKRVWQFALVLGVINIAMVIAAPYTGVAISWTGHLGGYLVGLLLAGRIAAPASTPLKF